MAATPIATVFIDATTYLLVQYKFKSSHNQDFIAEGDKAFMCTIVKQNWVIVHHELSRLFWYFLNTTAYDLGRYEPSSPSTKSFPDKIAVNALGGRG